MNTDIEKLLIKNAKQNVANKTTSLGDIEVRSDTNRYTSQSRFNDELKKVFNSLPTIVAHASEVGELDSYKEVKTTMGSLIVSRDSNNLVRVFRNACRHRGAKLVEGSGCSKLFVCPYHAWSYTTDGALNNIPGHQHCFPNTNKSDNGLIALPSIEMYGFIWVCPSAAENEDIKVHLTGHLAGMNAHLEWLKADELTHFKRFTKVWKGNWRLFSEGGLETYHFAFAHKETIAPFFYNNVAVIDKVDMHYRVVMPTKNLSSEEAQATDDLSLHDYSHTLFMLLPNTALLIQKEHVEFINFRPLSAGETEITITTLIPKNTDLNDINQLRHWQKNHDITNTTLNEDWALGESIQSSLESGALPYIQYGKNEWALHAFNEELNALLSV